MDSDVLQAAAFNTSYSDSGLFGVYTIAQADLAGEVTIKATSTKDKHYCM